MLSSAHGKVFGTKASHVVPMAIGYSHVELNENDIHAETHWVVLGCHLG